MKALFTRKLNPFDGLVVVCISQIGPEHPVAAVIAFVIGMLMSLTGESFYRTERYPEPAPCAPPRPATSETSAMDPTIELRNTVRGLVGVLSKYYWDKRIRTAAIAEAIEVLKKASPK